MNLVNRRNVLLGFGAVPLVLAGCGGNSGGGSAATNPSVAGKPIVDNLTDNIIVPTYVALNTQAAALIAAVEALAADIANEAKMDAAQAAWKATRVPWESSEGFLFGPVDALAIDPSIDNWPLDTAELETFMATQPSQAAVEAASDNVRGFHAIEYLLFGDGVADNDKAAAELTADEAAYLVALARAFKVRVNLLETSWTTAYNGGQPYATTLKTPGANNVAGFGGYGAVMEELINAIAGIADEVGNAKMAEPMGTAIGDADTSQVESQYSWNSLTDFHNNIQSVMNIYTGKRGFSWSTDTASNALNGVFSFVNAHDNTLANRVLTEIADVQKKIALIKGDGVNTTTAITGTAKPFREQIKTVDGRALITTAIAASNTLMNTLTTNVLPLIAKTTFTA